MSEPFSIAEIEQLRADTAGCSAEKIFFNNAGASLTPRAVVERVIEHLRLEEQMGGYEAGDHVREAQQAVYASLARLIGAEADEIAITESATRAWDMAFYALGFKPGDRIVTAKNEYSSNCIAFLQIAKRTGAEIVVVPGADSGEIDLDALEKTLRGGGVKVVALTHIATNNGMVQPAAEVGKLTRQHEVPFLLDACQSVGQMHLDMETLGCDMLSSAGRKFLRGPRGTGFLYVRRSFLGKLDPPFLDNHSANWSAIDQFTMRPDARRFELFESSLASALGLGVAAEYAMQIGLKRIEARVRALAARLRTKLEEIEGVTVTDSGIAQSGIVVFVHDKVPAARLVEQLAAHGIIARRSPRFGTRFDEKLSALDELVRASVHYYNTEDEVDRFCDVLAGLVKTA